MPSPPSPRKTCVSWLRTARPTCRYFDDEPWYRGSPQAVEERLARIFAVMPCRWTFIGHFHRWLLATPEAHPRASPRGGLTRART